LRQKNQSITLPLTRKLCKDFEIWRLWQAQPGMPPNCHNAVAYNHFFGNNKNRGPPGVRPVMVNIACNAYSRALPKDIITHAYVLELAGLLQG
jgi:hypothetical protein